VISFCSPFTLPFFDCSVFIYLPLMRLILLFSAWILWLYCFYLVCSNVCSCLICRRCDSIGNFARETGRIQLRHWSQTVWDFGDFPLGASENSVWFLISICNCSLLSQTVFCAYSSMRFNHQFCWKNWVNFT
jgi:hypothetical protein